MLFCTCANIKPAIRFETYQNQTRLKGFYLSLLKRPPNYTCNGLSYCNGLLHYGIVPN